MGLFKCSQRKIILSKKIFFNRFIQIPVICLIWTFQLVRWTKDNFRYAGWSESFFHWFDRVTSFKMRSSTSSPTSRHPYHMLPSVPQGQGHMIFLLCGFIHIFPPPPHLYCQPNLLWLKFHTSKYLCFLVHFVTLYCDPNTTEFYSGFLRIWIKEK